MLFSGSLLAVLSVALLPATTATTYDIVKEYSGNTFFDDWTFYDHFDNLTNGDAIFVSESVGKSSKLAYVDSSSGNAILKVDNTSTVVFNEKRNTVRISSNERYSIGSMWISDMVHVPYGCSVWPAFWSQAPNWPNGGEIDTFEGVNQISTNSMTLHTNPGCAQVNPVQSSTIVNSTDCSYLTNGNQGCIVTTPTTASYGAPFAAAGGGVFVTVFAEEGISVYFFSRKDVPASITSNSSSIDTAALGTPVANWPTGGCNMDTFFAAQHLILDISLCGDYAGSPSVFPLTCSGSCYKDYVVGNGSAYNNAYFEIKNIRVYSKTGTNTVVAGENGVLAKSPTTTFAAVVIVALVQLL